MTTEPLKAPFPYFGGKRKVAAMVWERFGDVANFIEPFCGSCAVLFARPTEPQTETVNDADGLLSNFWRAVRIDPDAVAGWADWPVNENDLHARHAWLVGRKESLQSQLEGDPEFFDAKVAGWWVWGMACWIGGGFCSGAGPWHVVDGELVNTGADGNGTQRRLVHVGDRGQGVNRKRDGVEHKRPVICGPAGGNGMLPQDDDLRGYFQQLANRLRRVRVCCGDWSRVCGPSVTFKHGVTGVFLDPPYADTAGRDPNIYRVDCEQVAHAVREWAVANGDNPLMRIALCGYEGEHQMPDTWDCHAWNAGMGYGGRNAEQTGNGKRERIWFNRFCLAPKQPELF